MSEAHPAEGRLDSDVHSRTFFGAGFVVASVSAAENRNSVTKVKFQNSVRTTEWTLLQLQIRILAVWLFSWTPLPFKQPAWQQQQEAGGWRTHWRGPDRHGLPTSADEQEPSVAWLRGLHEVTLYCQKVCRRDLLIKKALLDFDSGGFCKSATGAKFKNWSLSHTARSSSKAFLCKDEPRPEWVASDVAFCFKPHF